MEQKQEKQEFEKKKPDLQVSYRKSKDNRYLIVRTTITDIKPIGYLTAVLNSNPQE